MKIQRFKPNDPTLRSIIEWYLLVESAEMTEAQTIPNGRVDASIVLQGELHWFIPASQTYQVLPACTLYPPTRFGGKIRTPGNLYCFGIKFFPHLLALPMFDNQKLTEPLAFNLFFGQAGNDSLLISDLKETSGVLNQTKLLDTYFKEKLFPTSAADDWLQQVVHTIESGSSAALKMQQVAEQMGVSIKTLERRFEKAIGLTPKLFSKLIQLQQAVNAIRASNSNFSHGDLIESLGNGYYDQSHFTKSCLRITGLTPKQLFLCLPGPMTDLVILNK